MSDALQSEFLHLPLGGRSIEVAAHTFASAPDTILLLHEALGSVAYWKGFPQQLAHATGCNVLLYSRPGHGNSEGPIEGRAREDYLRQTESVIPALLRHFSVSCPILYGHSEGAAIAMLYAAETRRVKALIAESPFVIPQRGVARLIAQMGQEYNGSRLQERLRLYHRDSDTVFRAWVEWAANEPGELFLLQSFLPAITCPVLVIQGADDPFGAATHLEAMEASIRDLQHESLSGAGHLPHREQTNALLRRVRSFLAGAGSAAG